MIIENNIKDDKEFELNGNNLEFAIEKTKIENEILKINIHKKLLLLHQLSSLENQEN